MKIRFYDNEVSNFQGMTNSFPEMETIHVDHDTPNDMIKQDLQEYEDLIHKNFVGNQDLDRVVRVMYKTNYLNALSDTTRKDILLSVFEHPKLSFLSHEIRLPCNGITDTQIKDLMKWCKDFRSETKIVFFDWDRTISVVEGMVALKENPFIKPELSDNQIKEYIIYILGGIKRFEKIKKLFEFLHKMQVHVYILTANQAPIRYPESFKSMIEIIDPYLPQENIYCSARTITFPFQAKSKKTKQLQLKKSLWYKDTDVQQLMLPTQRQMDQYIQQETS